MCKYNKKSLKKLLRKFGSERDYQWSEILSYCKASFLQQDKINRIHYITKNYRRIISNDKELARIFI